MSDIIEISEERLDAIEKDLILESEVGDALMDAAIRDRDWPYVVGLMLMANRYMELPENLQELTVATLRQWGHEVTHGQLMHQSHDETYDLVKEMIREYNKTKGEED